jgi:hypothetical protein
MEPIMDSVSHRTATFTSAGHSARCAIAAAVLTLAFFVAAQSTAQTTSQGQTVGSTNITLMGTITVNLDDLMANGDSIDHQIAVWIPDTALSGSFSSVVTYTVT